MASWLWSLEAWRILCLRQPTLSAGIRKSRLSAQQLACGVFIDRWRTNWRTGPYIRTTPTTRRCENGSRLWQLHQKARRKTARSKCDMLTEFELGLLGMLDWKAFLLGLPFRPNPEPLIAAPRPCPLGASLFVGL